MVEQAPGQGVAAVPAKRGRGKSVDAARKRVVEAEQKLEKAQCFVDKAKKQTGYKTSEERRKETIDKAEAKLAVAAANPAEE